ncbi:MAG TPA: OB-fold domain-containing protein [Solirubrobacteraceae bacterium]
MSASPAERFAAGCRAGRLDYQWDPVAGRAVFYPRLVPDGLQWRTSAGLGTVHSTTTVHVRGEPPRNVALIDLDEGFRMMSRVRGLEPDDVRIGLRVRVAFEDGVPVFEAAP